MSDETLDAIRDGIIIGFVVALICLAAYGFWVLFI